MSSLNGMPKVRFPAGFSGFPSEPELDKTEKAVPNIRTAHQVIKYPELFFAQEFFDFVL